MNRVSVCIRVVGHLPAALVLDELLQLLDAGLLGLNARLGLESDPIVGIELLL